MTAQAAGLVSTEGIMVLQGPAGQGKSKTIQLMINHWVKSRQDYVAIGGDQFCEVVSKPDDQKTNAAICNCRVILIDEIAKTWPVTQDAVP